MLLSTASPSLPEPQSPWSHSPALHHLTMSLVSQLRKGIGAREDGRMIAPQGHLVTALACPLPTCNCLPGLCPVIGVPGRPCAENHGGGGNYNAAPVWG